ncbi:MAG: hypothetical protein WCJ32_02250 [Actinomycetota bacterium]
MPMRQECKNFESRTYAGGETVRKCNLDLAPDAPWRCPENCHAYERRLADVNWAVGSLITPPTPPEPPGLDDGTAAAVLDEAEDFLNQVGQQVMADMRRGIPPLPDEGKGLRRFFKRRGSS